MRRKLKGSGDSTYVRVRGGKAKVWFYRNESSIDIYVRPETPGAKDKPASICFRISAQDFVGRK